MDLSDLKAWHYGIIVGGIVLVLGLLLYFLGVRKVKVPTVVPAGFAGLAAGFAAGVIWLAGFGYKPIASGDDEPPAEGAPKGGAPKMGGAPKGGGAPKMGAPAPRGPRVQLVNLISALEELVDRPVTLSLTAEDRAAVAAQLQGLDTAEEIKDDDAKAKLDTILKVLEKDRKALETVGYRWPSPDGKAPAKAGFMPPPANTGLDAPNPFQAPATKVKLQTLLERLAR